jgi:hypothetical protein
VKALTNTVTHLHSYCRRISFKLVQLRAPSSPAAASIAQHFVQHWQPVVVEGCSTSQVAAALRRPVREIKPQSIDDYPDCALEAARQPAPLRFNSPASGPLAQVRALFFAQQRCYLCTVRWPAISVKGFANRLNMLRYMQDPHQEFIALYAALKPDALERKLGCSYRKLGL